MEETGKNPEPMMTHESEEPEAPEILEEIAVEELAIDGICGVY
ncbi:variant-type mycofactocin precursor [Deferrisoma palaeochoriense]